MMDNMTGKEIGAAKRTCVGECGNGVCVSVCMCVCIMTCVAASTQHGEQGSRSSCTIQLLQKSLAIACRVTLNTFSGVLDACTDGNL